MLTKVDSSSWRDRPRAFQEEELRWREKSQSEVVESKRVVEVLWI